MKQAKIEEDLKWSIARLARGKKLVYDKGARYGRLQALTDIRKARGKRYSLTTLLMIVLLAKLSRADSPTAIAEWGIHHQGEIEIVLRIKPKRMPERSTYRRLKTYKVYETEIERMVGGIQSKRQVRRHLRLGWQSFIGHVKARRWHIRIRSECVRCAGWENHIASGSGE